jgi:hypothetical protein
MNVVHLFGGAVLPDEFRDADPIMSAKDRDYAATAALAGMFTLVFENPSIDMDSLACKDPEMNGEPYRWFIPAGRPLPGISPSLL